MRVALSIAGFDPTGGAGLQQDLKVFHSLGVYGISAVAALTAQNTRGVSMAVAVEGGLLRRQLDTLLSDITPQATKIGMLYSAENARVVAGIIKRFGLGNVVIDPVLRPSRGRALSETGLPLALRKSLLPLCRVVTPNIHEASVLAGMQIRDRRDMEKAAVKIRGFGAGAVVITGGHLAGAAEDLLFDGEFARFPGRRHSGEFHGTGCCFASALAAMLAKGYDVAEALKRTKRFLQGRLLKTISIGGGMRLFDI